MKKFQLLSCILGIALLLSSCASQHRVQLVGHYKPNTEVAKSKTSAPVSSPEEMMKPLPAQNENELVASTNEATPDLKLVHPVLQSFAAQNALTEKQVKKLDKKIEKVKVKLEKHSSQIGKQIQQNRVSSNIKEKKFHLASGDDQLLCVIISIFIPPLGVFLWEDEITNHFWIDLILTILFYLPGLIYALIVILGG